MNRTTVETAESWQNLRPVTPIRRLFAHIIDSVAWATVSYWQFTAFSNAEGPSAMIIASASSMLALLIVYLIFAMKGRTLGKWMLGIKIIKNDGRTAGFGTVVIRDVFGKFVSTIFLYLGFLWILFDSRNQGWHDKLMGTTVVYAKDHAALTE